jgi:hypothetical protein
MIHSTNTNEQSQTKNLQKIYWKTYVKAPPMFEEVFNTPKWPANRTFATTMPIIGLGQFALKPEGAAPKYDSMAEGTPTTFTFATFALAYKITEEGREEDPERLYKRLPEMLAYSGVVSKENLVWTVFNMAFNGPTSVQPVLGTDGQPLCSSTHLLEGVPGQQYTNNGGLTTLTPESFQNALTNYQLMPDDRGLPMYKTPRKLIVHPNIISLGQTCLHSELYPYSSDNRPNLVKGATELFSPRYLTLTNSWFLAAGKGDEEADTHSLVAPFHWKDRVRTWEDAETGNESQRSSFRLSTGWEDWRGFYGAQGAAIAMFLTAATAFLACMHGALSGLLT